MSFYTRLYDFLAGATVRSQEFDDEFNAIAAASRTTIRAVDEVATDLPNAAARANRLMSFDASGQPQASNSVPDPVADTDVANKRWVQTLALSATLPVLPGDAGKVLGNNGSTVQWTTTDTLFPSMTGNAGKVLGTDGSTVQWTTTDTLFPSMTGNAGKVLGTDGSTVQWTTTDTLFPSMTGNAGKVLGTDGTTRSWMRPVITITFDNRGDMRSLSGVDLQAWVLVDGLGVFQHMAGVDEGPDDDETAFATASGYWLLVCPSWDVVEAMRLQHEDGQSSRHAAAADFSARFLQKTEAKTSISVAIGSQITFTATVPGAAQGASVIVNPPGSPSANTVTTHAWISAVDTITVYVGNASSAAAQGFNAGDWQFTVINKG